MGETANPSAEPVMTPSEPPTAAPVLSDASVAMGPQAAPNPGPASRAPVSMGPQAAPNPGPASRAPATAPSADLRARETVREPTNDGVRPQPRAPAELVLVQDDDPEDIDDPAESAPAAPPVVAEAKVVEAVPSSDTQPSTPAPALKKVATEAEVPPPVASFTAAPAKPEREPAHPLTATLRTEPPKAAPAKAEEVLMAAPRSEPAKVDVPKKLEEPKKALPIKPEEPRKAKAGEPKPSASKKGSPVKVESEPGSRRPAALRAVRDGEAASKPSIDDELDPSSISAEFFRKDEDSVPPIEEHDEHDAAPVLLLSPSTLARRARLRRMVAGVVAFAGVISIAVVGKQVSASKRPVAPAIPAVVVEAKHEAPLPPAPVNEEAKPQPSAEPQKVAAVDSAKAEAEPKAAEKADDKKADEAAKKDDDKKADEAAKKADEVAKKDDDKKADEAVKKADEKPAPSGADAEALKKETLSLLNRGRNKDAIEKAREAIAADGTDATSYLYLGSALQDSGKWKDGVEAYSECVRNATKGPVNECRAMGGHK
jgi:outer membrane biosynthesis protein TonB